MSNYFKLKVVLIRFSYGGILCYNPLMIKAVIFDMDGVISDTQKLHAEVEADLLNRYGINISPDEITRKYAGRKTTEMFDELLKNQSQSYDLNSLMQEKWEHMKILADRSVDQIDGSIELVRRLYDAKIKMAVASSSNYDYVKQVIKSLNLQEYFEALISGDMVANGKPDPEIFLLAALKLGMNPVNCVVIEDGRSGMEAAKSAHMKCIGLVSSKNQAYPTANLILSLKEINFEYLKGLL